MTQINRSALLTRCGTALESIVASKDAELETGTQADHRLTGDRRVVESPTERWQDKRREVRPGRTAEERRLSRESQVESDPVNQTLNPSVPAKSVPEFIGLVPGPIQARSMLGPPSPSVGSGRRAARAPAPC
jgi:hypothetical protein